MVLQKTVSRAVKCIHANGRGSELPKQKGSRSSGSGFHKAGRCISRGASNQTSTLIDNHLEKLPLTTLLCSANRRISLPCAPKRTPRRFRRCATSRHGSSIALRIAVNAQTLLNAAQGHPMLVELKNGETLNGHLVQCDTWMNLTLREVVQTSPIKYLRVDDDIINQVSESQRSQQGSFRGGRGGHGQPRGDHGHGGRGGGDRGRGGRGGGRGGRGRGRGQ
ncbi:Like-Sm ribonucleoprotein (LSM)-related domain protein, partial [Metarhizium hybridum]